MMTGIHYLKPLVRSQNDLQTVEIFLAQFTLWKTTLLSEQSQPKMLSKIMHIF